MDRLDLLLAVQVWGDRLLALSALVAPLTLPVLALLVARGRPHLQSKALASGCLAAVVYSPLALVFAICHGAYVGEPPTARIGYRWAEPVIAGLERYRVDHGRYPDSLGLLVPTYVRERAQLALPSRGSFVASPHYARDS